MSGKTLESAPLTASPALCLVIVSAPADKAESLARDLLEKRLCACVNVVPGVVSLYWWEAAITRDTEALLLVKTRAELVAELTRAILAVHPYSVPEVIGVGIQPGVGNPAYHAWVAAETEASGGAR